MPFQLTVKRNIFFFFFVKKNPTHPFAVSLKNDVDISTRQHWVDQVRSVLRYVGQLESPIRTKAKIAKTNNNNDDFQQLLLNDKHRVKRKRKFF